MPPKGKKPGKGEAIPAEQKSKLEEDASEHKQPETTDEPETESEQAEKERSSETKTNDADASKDEPNTGPKKRKAADDKAKEPSKASRRSSRGAPKSQPSQVEILSFLLTQEAIDICRPDDEVKDLEERGQDIRTYAGSEMSPFEELLCAIILSRPISHKLGLRTIRTVLNDPYNFTSPKAILDATPEERHEAMFEARTQHKDKTATQIGMLAKVVSEELSKDPSDTSLEQVRSENNKDWDSMRDALQKPIKGLGKTGLDIFFRRVQWLWPEVFPFVDERTARGVEKLGLPKKPEDLAKLIRDNWSELDTSLLPHGDEEKAQRRAFVVICERATSADLEGKGEQLLEAAGAK